MKLSPEEVRHIALLARLGLSEDEMERFREQLSDILEHFEVLQEVDTADVEPTFQVTGMLNVVAEDEATESSTQEDILANAPRAEDGFFRIRAVLE